MACEPARPSACCPICSHGQTKDCQELRIIERPTPFVSLPLGATEDRVTGTIDLEHALTHGGARFEPGVLAKAHRGVLYIDEVNLLPDHLVDLLLDVAATGVHHVEREGMSVTHPARFMLVGTMNPEEGELRPQLLDRFGLSVGVEEFSDPIKRGEVVRRALAFEADQEAFLTVWKGPEEEVRLRLEAARQRLPRVTISPAVSRHVTAICLEARVEGLRADLVMHRAAVALAAWEGREVVTEGDVTRVADLALSHRRREPPDAPPPGRQRLSSDRDPGRKPPSSQPQNPAADGAQGETQTVEQPPETPMCLALPPPVSTPAKPANGNNMSAQGRGKKAEGAAWQGPSIRSVMPRGPVTRFALGATLRAAAFRGAKVSKSERNILIRPADFRVHDRRAPQARLFVFIVDASRSMGASSRLASAKGALLGLLETAYRKRDRVALIVCAGTQAILAVPPTRSARVAQRRLHGLPAAGRTPLAAGLELAHQLAQREQRRSNHAISIILLSDGRCNVSHRGLSPVAAVEAEIGRLVRREIQVLLIDVEDSKSSVALMPAWGRRFGLSYLRLDDLKGRRLADVIRAYLDAPGLPVPPSDRGAQTRAAC